VRGTFYILVLTFGADQIPDITIFTRFVWNGTGILPDCAANSFIYPPLRSHSLSMPPVELSLLFHFICQGLKPDNRKDDAVIIEYRSGMIESQKTGRHQEIAPLLFPVRPRWFISSLFQEASSEFSVHQHNLTTTEIQLLLCLPRVWPLVKSEAYPYLVNPMCHLLRTSSNLHISSCGTI